MKRTYSLFEKIDGRWYRLSRFSYSLKAARSNWQTSLILGSTSGHYMELRPVSPKVPTDDEAEEYRLNWTNFHNTFGKK